MKSVYEDLIEQVERGASFHIDLQKRNLKVNKKWIMKEGVFEQLEERELFGKLNIYEVDILSHIEELYHQYKYSLPSESSDKRRRTYFKALTVDDLSDAEMVLGERRDVAQFKLELFILFSILEHAFEWDEDRMGKWFWQSNKDSDLVILKQWIM